MSRIGSLAVTGILLIAHALFGLPTTVAEDAVAGPPPLLSLDLDDISPRLATAEDDTMTVSGTVTNIGDQPVHDVVARLQTGQPQTSEQQLSTALDEPHPAETAVSEWVDVADTLEPGQQEPVSLTVPRAELELTTPGVHPMLVNLNGAPAYGEEARLAALPLLVPVLEPSPDSQPDPTPVSMLWPIAATEPKVAAEPHDGPIVLSDDELAEELAPGGRLDALVGAASDSRGETAVFDSLCFAVDPDLLETVEEMSTGYKVETPSGKRDGSGQAVAERWLEDLREVVSGHCVIQVPFADSDLTTLNRVSSEADLLDEAVNNSAAVLDLLNLEPRSGVTWPEDMVNQTVLDGIGESGVTTVIGDPREVGLDSESGITGLAGEEIRFLPYDPLVADAFTARPDTAEPGQETAFATQNALATLAFRTGIGQPGTERPMLVAPPHDWDVSHSELITMLDSVEELEETDALRPAPLDELLAEDEPGGVGNGATPPDDQHPTLPPEEISALSNAESSISDLRESMSVDPTQQVDPTSLIEPLRNAVVRATSRGWPDDEAREQATTVAENQLKGLTSQVSVTTPDQPVSLASGSSPLPVTLSNALPVAVTVRTELHNTAGLRPARIHDTPLAAHSSVGRLIPTEALRSGRFSIEVSLITPGGTDLGGPARLELTSNEFGTATVVLTATAAVALALLFARRIYSRTRQRKQEDTPE